MKRLGFLLVTMLLVWSGAALAAEDMTQLTGRIQKKYASITAFSANFTQAIHNASSGDTEQRSGTIAFKKPTLVRWETVKPEKELLVVGPHAVWDYFEEDKEVYRYSVKEIINSKTMLRFLTGRANLSQDFLVVPAKEQATVPDQVVLDLAPREPEPGLVMARIWVDLKTDLIARIRIQDFYANTNDLTLTDLVINPSLRDTLFAFTPGKDVRIHDNLPAQEHDLRN